MFLAVTALNVHFKLNSTKYGPIVPHQSTRIVILKCYKQESSSIDIAIIDTIAAIPTAV